MRLVKKHADVGYQTPGERPGCRNCAYFDHLQRQSTAAFAQICSKHELEVTSGGICPSHQLSQRPHEADERQLVIDAAWHFPGTPEWVAQYGRQLEQIA